MREQEGGKNGNYSRQSSRVLRHGDLQAGEF